MTEEELNKSAESLEKLMNSKDEKEIDELLKD